MCLITTNCAFYLISCTDSVNLDTFVLGALQILISYGFFSVNGDGYPKLSNFRQGLFCKGGGGLSSPIKALLVNF